MSPDRRKRLRVFRMPVWRGFAWAQNGVGLPHTGCDFVPIIKKDVVIYTRHFDRCLRPHMAIGKQNLTNLMVCAYSPWIVRANICNQWENNLLVIANIGKLAPLLKWQAMRVTRRSHGRKA